MRLQLGRCEPELPVPRLWRARSGVEARTRGGSRHCSLRVGARADGGARGVVPQPAAACRRRARRKIRPLRGNRLHPCAPAARANQRRRAFVHGASPGHDPALPRSLAARPSDAEAFRVGPAVQGNPSVAAGAHSEGRSALFAPRRTFRDSWDFRRSGGAGTRTRQSRHADTGSAAAVERPIPRHGHERGRREQPMEGPRRHPLARRQHLRQLGHVLLHPRRGERGLLVDRASADAEALGTLRSDIHRSTRRISPTRQRLRIAYRDRRFAGRRHRAAPAPHHQPLADAADDRCHELRGSRSRVACRGRAASGVLQSLRADRDHPAAASHPVHASAPIAARSSRPGCFT